jgi:integrase
MNALVQVVGPTALAATDVDLLKAMQFARAEKAPATRRAYRSDFAAFQSWCQGKGLAGLPAEPETIAAYLASEAERGIKAATIGRRVAAIRHAHKLAGHEPPTGSEIVKTTVRGIRRSIGAAKARKAPLVAEAVRAMAQAAPAGLKGLRDRALLLLGFAGAFRRSELVALDVSDIREEEDGARVTIRRSKTDQEGLGVTIAVVRGGTAATCPVRARRQRREGLRQPPGARRCRIQRPQPAQRLPDQRRPPRRFRLQDARRLPAQVDGRAAGLRARCRAVP